MARSLIQYRVVVNEPYSGLPVPVAGASGSVYRTGTLITPVMYLSQEGGSPISNPVIANSFGEFNIWLDESEDATVDIHVDDTYGGPLRRAAMRFLLPITPYTVTVTADFAASGGSGGAGGFPPTVLHDGDVYEIPEERQMLTTGIEREAGSVLVINAGARHTVMA